MTRLLEKAFEQASRLPEAEQDVLASRLLEELAAEDAFDQAIANSGGKLAKLAAKALEDYEAGRTEPLDPEKL